MFEQNKSNTISWVFLNICSSTWLLLKIFKRLWTLSLKVGRWKSGVRKLWATVCSGVHLSECWITKNQIYSDNCFKSYVSHKILWNPAISTSNLVCKVLRSFRASVSLVLYMKMWPFRFESKFSREFTRNKSNCLSFTSRMVEVWRRRKLFPCIRIYDKLEVENFRHISSQCRLEANSIKLLFFSLSVDNSLLRQKLSFSSIKTFSIISWNIQRITMNL